MGWTGLVFGLALMVGLGGKAMTGRADEPSQQDKTWCDVLAWHIENDEAAGTDRHYTGGSRWTCVRSTPQQVERWLKSLVPDNAVSHHSVSYSLGQNVYTPDDLTVVEPIEDDQPYAGWLYLDFGVDSEVSSASGDVQYLDNFGLQLGIVGPLSGAEQVQRYTHRVSEASEPQGWDNQLDNERGLNLFYSRQWTGLIRSTLPEGRGDQAPPPVFDMSPKVGAALGNVYIYGAAGLMFRLGYFPEDDHGPPAIRPSFSGSDSFPEHESWSAYLFGGVEGRAVGRNLFLDGNSFDRDSPSVDKNSVVGEARLGMAMIIGDARLAYTHVFRSQEFQGQEPQIYGGVTLAVRI